MGLFFSRMAREWESCYIVYLTEQAHDQLELPWVRAHKVSLWILSSVLDQKLFDLWGFFSFSVHQSKRPVLRRRNVLQDHANERAPYSKIVFSWWYLTLALLFCIIANYLKRFSFLYEFPCAHLTYYAYQFNAKTKKKLAFFCII